MEREVMTMSINNFPYWFARLLQQLTLEELDRYFRPHPYAHEELDIQAAILRVVEDIYRQFSRDGEIDAALETRLLNTLKEYISILD